MTHPAPMSRPINPRELVVACLHYDGACRDFPSIKASTVQAEARRLCDGFGDAVAFAAACELDPDCFWDWSHVRDSSDDALRRASTYLINTLTTSGEIAEAIDAIRARLAI